MSAVAEPDPSPWATDLLRYIVESGGYVHPSIVVRADRTVRIQDTTLPSTSTSATTIPRNTVLLTIPSLCCVTKQDCSERFVAAVEERASELTMDPGDLLLAFHLATIDDSKASPYVRSFPPTTSYNSHPRRWSHAQQSSLLGGTSLLTKCREDAQALKRDYETVRAGYTQSFDGDDTPSDVPFAFPSYERFDDAFAAVSSRGFAGLGSDGSDAMVPLLDLLNHRRGTSTHSSSNGKDVRYRRVAGTKGSQASIEVVADRELSAGTILHDTYGAKGNSQLLNRYGFCLETNWEPDRSCNDVVEFKIEQPYEDPSVTVELRAGPKSYTYGGFVKALECFLFNDEEQNDGGDDDEDGMEAFLEEEEDEEGFGMMYGTMDDEMEDDDDMNQSTQAECTALEKLSVSLETARQGYTLQGPALENALARKDCSPEHCAALLITSERRTLRLFQLAADTIRQRLRGEYIDTGVWGMDLLLVDQMEELVTAYGAIRHDGYPPLSRKILETLRHAHGMD